MTAVARSGHCAITIRQRARQIAFIAQSMPPPTGSAKRRRRDDVRRYLARHALLALLLTLMNSRGRRCSYHAHSRA